VRRCRSDILTFPVAPRSADVSPILRSTLLYASLAEKSTPGQVCN
jgi:hypothetical protein